MTACYFPVASHSIVPLRRLGARLIMRLGNALAIFEDLRCLARNGQWLSSAACCPVRRLNEYLEKYERCCRNQNTQPRWGAGQSCRRRFFSTYTQQRRRHDTADNVYQEI